MTRLQILTLAGLGLIAIGSMLAVLLVRGNRREPLLTEQMRDVMQVRHPPKAAGSKLRAVRHPDDLYRDAITAEDRLKGKQVSRW
jgi:hypothetical protein